MTDDELIAHWTDAAAAALLHYGPDEGPLTSLHVPAGELARLCELATVNAPRMISTGPMMEDMWVTHPRTAFTHEDYP